MSYAIFEKEGHEIFNEKKFRKFVCNTCQYQNICEAWEFETGQTIYSNHKKGTHNMFTAPSGKKGVYRCAEYTEKETHEKCR